MTKLTYLASPYSHPDEAVKEQRFIEACKAAAAMMRAGQFVFSPIAHTHPIALHGLPGDWHFWEEYDRVMLSHCDDLAVLMLPGWEISKGVQAEIQIVAEMHKPIRGIYPEDVQQHLDIWEQLRAASLPRGGGK